MSSLASSSSSESSSLASSSSSEPSYLASLPSSEPILTFEYDVLLTFFNGLDEDRPRTFLENRLREAGLKTLVADIVNDSTWEMIESCRIVMVLITPELVRSQIERLDIILSLPKTVLHFFYGVNQNHVSGELMRFRRPSCDDWTFDWDLHRRSDVVCDLLFGFTLSDDLGDQEAVNDFIEKSISQVGVQLRVKKVLHELGWITHHTRNTITVGVFGVGGIGKTTLVRTLYDKIGGHFDCRTFLANIKDAWESNNGQFLLRKQLLSDIQMNRTRQGPSRSALIVLDDVNQEDQLTGLCRNKERFGKGSLILVTSTNKGLINWFADISYEVEKLDDSESLELFSWHAFKNLGPTNDFVYLSREVITFCEGLPLILEVIGSLLHNKTKSKWENVLNKLKKVPRSQIQQMLKISFDFLVDSEQNLFCDIARFHAGQRTSYLTHLFKGSRFPIEMGLKVLIEHRLIKVVNDKIHVHDLLQEIGREITTDNQKFTCLFVIWGRCCNRIMY